MIIPVTKPFLPPKSRYEEYLDGIWDREWLTNNGPLVNNLEDRLKAFTGVKNLLFTSNGTIALQIAISSLELTGDIVTTPFSYVATTSSIVWEKCRPIMADIEPDTLNIDPAKIRDLITENTTAILATHVFGNPCDVENIENIAKEYKLKVIYDAAHAFGTLYKGLSVLSYGDISTCSFHATKLFHTIEGGCVITANAEYAKAIALRRNFGHISPEEFASVGINGKNSEFHAAMGLCNLDYLDEIISSRKALYNRYLGNLAALPIAFQSLRNHTTYNYAYMPILFPVENMLLKAISALNANGIFPRRYFYPSLSTLPYVEDQQVPLAESISKRVLCLPLFYSLSFEELDLICSIIKQVLK